MALLFICAIMCDMTTNGKLNLNLFKNAIFDLGLMFITCGLVIVIVFSTPSKRFAEAISKADKYYTDMNYEKALKYYEKASDIYEDSVRGYLGYILSDMALGSEETAEKYTEFAGYVLNTGSVREGEEDSLIDFFLLSSEVLSDYIPTRVEIMDSAYEKFDEPADLKTSVADAHYEYGMLLGTEDYEEATAQFDRALELSDNSGSYIEGMSNVIVECLEYLKTNDDYDEAFALLEKYATVLNLDYDTLHTGIENAESFYNIKCELLKNVYDAMSPYYDSYADSFSEETVEAFDNPVFRVLEYDWSQMLVLDGSAYADSLVSSFSQNEYVYAESGFTTDYTGLAAGLYPYGETYTKEDGTVCQGYYFYFGQYENGQRNGYGVMFAKTDSTSYIAFEGNFKNDKPNGFGVEYKSNMYAYTSLAEYRQVTYGNYTDGAMDGTMRSKAVLNEHPDTYFTGSYTADKGNVEALPGTPLDYNIVSDVKEGVKLICIMPSVDDGYDYFLPIYVDEGALLGVLGF